MKKNFLHWAMLLTAGLGLALASCSDSDDDGPAESPVFPDAVEQSILPGESHTLTFEANMKWEASIPETVAQVYYIADGEHKTLKQSGEAGSAAVTIGTYEVENFDEIPACEVTLTMGGQSKVIATLTVGQQERVLTLRTSKMDGGDFAYNSEDDGLRYKYNDDPAEKIELTWPTGRSGYMYPIIVEANFAWRLSEKAEWIAEENYEGEAGEQVEILLRADPTKYPLDGDEAGKFVLCARSNPDLKYAYTVTIPACRDHFTISGFVAESRFNVQGQFYNAGAASWVDNGTHGNIVSASEPVIYKFAVTGTNELNSEESATSWLKIAGPRVSDEDNVLKDYRYDITVEENAGEAARNAVIVALPASKASEISGADDLKDANGIKEAYQKYIVTKVNQAGTVAEKFVEFYENLGMDQYFSLSELPKGEWPYEGSWASVPAIYNLTYTTEQAGEMAELKFNTTYDSYEVYGEEGPYAQSELNPRWVDLANGYNGDNCKLIKIACSYDSANDKYVWDYDKPTNPVAYFVFKNGSEIVGIIEFKFEEKEEETTSGISLVQETQGVTLVELASGDEDFDADIASLGVPQYKLTLTGSMIMANLYLPEYDDYNASDDKISIYAMGSYYMLMYDTEENRKAQVSFKKNYYPIAYLVVEYKTE